MKAILTIGISASGKSTWAKQQQSYVVVERDIIRRQLAKEMFSLEDNTPLSSVWNFRSKEIENLVTKEHRNLLQSCASLKQDVIVSDTNLNNEFRYQLVDFLKSLGYEVEYKYFSISIEEAIQRDMQRLDVVGENILRVQAQQLARVVIEKPVLQGFGRKKPFA